jgi:hypothetical protein
VNIKSKRNGPKHRVKKDEIGEAFPNGWLESLIVFLFLGGMFFGAYGIYMISQVS